MVLIIFRMTPNSRAILNITIIKVSFTLMNKDRRALVSEQVVSLLIDRCSHITLLGHQPATIAVSTRATWRLVCAGILVTLR